MKIVFRVDSSLQIGSGHVMRCLTLASALAAAGARCWFISRSHPGNLHALVRARGFGVIELGMKADDGLDVDSASTTAHAKWLGSDWQTDARQTRAALAELQPDWLVTDHYALNASWESAVAGTYRKLLVIDDLADRSHLCDLLLDQNLGRDPAHYAGKLNAECAVMTGPHYALLRPEFAELRVSSTARREDPVPLQNVLITMGGVDEHNATGAILQILRTCQLPESVNITVIMGLTAPWLTAVRDVAGQMPWPTEVVVNATDMGERLARADLAIGAAGSTSWERCCLAVPTLMFVLADNQREAARHLHGAGAVRCLERSVDLPHQLRAAIASLVNDPCSLTEMSKAAGALVDGAGVGRVVLAMEQALQRNTGNE